jgi:predicted translin family RNA/ssDNA-binding protein
VKLVKAQLLKSFYLIKTSKNSISELKNIANVVEDIYAYTMNGFINFDNNKVLKTLRKYYCLMIYNAS